jgi:hypothetical protein
LRHARLGPTGRITGPALGQVEFKGNRQAGQVIGDRQRHSDLAVLLLAQLAAILAGHANRVRALLGKARVVDDPGSAQAVSLEGRQYLLTHGGEHGCVAPRCCGDEVMQCLMQAGHVGRVEAGCHRLDALALAG